MVNSNKQNDQGYGENIYDAEYEASISDSKNQSQQTDNTSSQTFESTVESDGTSSHQGSFEKMDDFDPEAIINESRDRLEEITKEGYKISEQFSEASGSQVFNEAKEELQTILQKIKDSNEQKGFLSSVRKRLPSVVRRFTDKVEKKATEVKFDNQSVSKTTQDIFNSLEDHKDSISNQTKNISDMKDGVHRLVNGLGEQLQELGEKYNYLLENGYFEYNSRSQLEMEELINSTKANIEVFKRQYEDIEQAQLTTKAFLFQLTEQMPNLRSTLINGLTTMSYLNDVSQLNDNFNDLSETMHNISIGNSEKIKDMVIEVTNTKRYQERALENLKETDRIRQETMQGVKKNQQERIAFNNKQAEHFRLVDAKNKEQENNFFKTDLTDKYDYPTLHKGLESKPNKTQGNS